MTPIPASPIRDVLDARFTMPGRAEPRVLLACGHTHAVTPSDDGASAQRACWKCRAGQPVEVARTSVGA